MPCLTLGVLLAADADGYVIFHLFVISVKPIYPREALLIEAAQGWIVAQGEVVLKN